MSSSDTQCVDIAIIGGGITGLATAYYLRNLASQSNQPLRMVLLERTRRVGGKILTETIPVGPGNPFIVEGGPDSFLTQKPWALQLSRQLGLDDRILGTNDQNRKVFVLNRGKLTPMPDGLHLIVPTQFIPFVLSPLISPLGKLRMALDLFIPARRDNEDETLAEFITRRLGTEALYKIAEPLMSGIYNSEADRQSVLATFPRFRDIERNHGSLIKGMLAARRSASSNRGSSAGSVQNSSSRPTSAFVSFLTGTEELVDALVNVIGDDIRYNSQVAQITQTNQDQYLVACSPGASFKVKSLVVTVPAYTAATMLKDIAPSASEHLKSIRYVSTGTISLGYRRQDVSHPLNGFGVMIPRGEKRDINAITWTSAKFDHRAPADHVLIRTFFGGSRNPDIFDRSDDELIAIARRELLELLQIDAAPVVQRLFRWRKANPQYDVGHLHKVDVIESALPSGIFVAGSPYRGIGIPDCVHQAQEAADKTWAYVNTQSDARVHDGNSPTQ